MIIARLLHIITYSPRVHCLNKFLQIKDNVFNFQWKSIGGLDDFVLQLNFAITHFTDLKSNVPFFLDNTNKLLKYYRG